MVLSKFTEQDMLGFNTKTRKFILQVKKYLSESELYWVCPNLSVSEELLDTERHMYKGQNTWKRPENRQN